MVGILQPLDRQFAIADANGRPTDYFIRWAQQKQIDIGDSISLQQLQDFLTAHKLTEGLGIALTPDGDLNNSPSIAIRNGTGLNFDAMHNLKLADTAVVPGTYGDATHVPQITVDEQGRLTGVTPIAVSGGGGGGSSYASPAQTGAGSTYTSGTATSGNVLILAKNISVSAIVATFNPIAAGKTYTASLVTLNPANFAITGTVATSSTPYTTVGTTMVSVRFPFTTPAALTAGTMYAVVLILTSDTASTANRGQYTGAAPYPSLPVDNGAMIQKTVNITKWSAWVSNIASPTAVAAAGGGVETFMLALEWS